MHSLGKLLLALACRSLMAVQRESIQTSVELVARTYSTDLRNLIVSLLSTTQRSRSIVDLMPLIGARFVLFQSALLLFPFNIGNILVKLANLFKVLIF